MIHRLMACAAALLVASPALADRDPDLGMEMVSPPAAAAEEATTDPAPEAKAEESAPAAKPAPAPAPPVPAPPAQAAVPEPIDSDESARVPPSGTVSRSVFTTTIQDREPQNSITELGNDAGKVSFFTELTGFQGQTVMHRWEWNGEVMAEVPFTVGGPRWRVHSTKSLAPGWVGRWTVSVVDGGGNVITQNHFDYTKSSAGAQQREGDGNARARHAIVPANLDEAASTDASADEAAGATTTGTETATEGEAKETAEESTAPEAKNAAEEAENAAEEAENAAEEAETAEPEAKDAPADNPSVEAGPEEASESGTDTEATDEPADGEEANEEPAGEEASAEPETPSVDAGTGEGAEADADTSDAETSDTVEPAEGDDASEEETDGDPMEATGTDPE